MYTLARMPFISIEGCCEDQINMYARMVCSFWESCVHLLGDLRCGEHVA